MTRLVIQARGLSKRYRLGAGRPADQTFREMIYHLAGRVATMGRRCLPGTHARTDGASAPAPRQDQADFWALRDVSFDVRQGEVVGIIGRNGAGKSTLLKILSRITDPTEGEAQVRGRVGSLLEVGTGFHPELTGRENIYLNGAILGMRKAEIERKFDDIVAFAEVERFMDTPVKRYSSGMYVRLAFAVAAHLEPRTLIVDEVLAVGDSAFQKKCLGKMSQVAQSGRTVLFVSHNLGAVATLCSRAILLQSGRVAADGPVRQVIAEYQSRGAAPAAALDLSSHPDRVGKGTVRFRAARVRDQHGRVAQDFFIGDTVRVELEIEPTVPSARIAMALILRGGDGTPLSFIMNRDSGFEFGPIQQRVTVGVSFPDIRLYPDRYSLGLWVGSADGREWYDRVDDCLSFNIVEGGSVARRPLPRSSGVVFFTPQWQVAPAAADAPAAGRRAA